jgi:hypothetical protein
VVETDIASCFSAIPHEKLMQAVEERVCDQPVLKLLRAMLRAGVMEDGQVRRTVTGTPQGGLCEAEHNDPVGYSLNRTCPAQKLALRRSDLGELNPRPAPMTFSYRSWSAHVNIPNDPYEQRRVMRSAGLLALVTALPGAERCA